MTALTLHRPQSTGRSATFASLPSQGRARVRRSRLHLTRRGRLFLLVALVGVGIAAMLLSSGAWGAADAGTTPSAPATRIVVVQPGQTLWSIAGEVAPGVDRRDTIARIVEINALPNSAVSAGARLAVPVR